MATQTVENRVVHTYSNLKTLICTKHNATRLGFALIDLGYGYEITELPDGRGHQLESLPDGKIVLFLIGAE